MPNISSDESTIELFILQEFDVILNHIKKIYTIDKVTIKSNICKITYSNLTSFYTTITNVKIKDHKRIELIDLKNIQSMICYIF